MNSHLIDDDDDLVRNRNERELTLSTGSILGIFFGLALICGLFFGFGYNMGRKSSPAPVTASDSAYDNESTPATAPISGSSASSKPSAGSFVPASSNVEKPRTAEEMAGSLPEHATAPQPAEVVAPSTPAPKPVEPQPTKPTAAVAASPRPVSAGSLGAGSFVVQVAAVSHQEDADLLVSALQHKGYAVAARSEVGDKLVHIQVGPFSDRKEADAMRNRLITDGYNAMIKQI